MTLGHSHVTRNGVSSDFHMLRQINKVKAVLLIRLHHTKSTRHVSGTSPIRYAYKHEIFSESILESFILSKSQCNIALMGSHKNTIMMNKREWIYF